MQRRLATAAREWLEADREPSFLLRGSQLVRFEASAARSDLALTEHEKAFLEASLSERAEGRAAEEMRLARERELERRSVHRLRALVAVLTIAAAVAAGLTVFAFDQSSSSKHEARIATARQLAAAAVANLDVDPELSILLGLRAVETTRSGNGTALPEAVDALHRAVAASRLVRRIPGAGSAAVAFSPDGSRLATAGSSEVRIWNPATGRRVLTLAAPPSPIHDVAYSPDGSRLATRSEDGTAIVWDARTGKRLLTLPDNAGGGRFSHVSFSPDGTRLATDDTIGGLRIWDLRNRRAVLTIRSSHPLCGIAWSPDGTEIGSGDCGTLYAGATGRVWDARTGRLLFATRRLTGAVLTIQFSPAGRYVALPSLNGTAEVWNTATARLVTTFTGHTGQLNTLAYSPDGGLIATGGTDDTARIWDPITGSQLLVLRGDNGPISDVAFGPDGRTLATASEDGSVRIWNVTTEGSRDWFTLVAHRGGVESVTYSGNGRELLTTGFVDGRAKLWNARTGALVDSFKTPAQPGAGIIPASYRSRISLGTTGPDGEFTARVALDGTAGLYTATGGTLLQFGTEHGGVQGVAFDGKSRRFATGYRDGTVAVWDLASRRPLLRFAAQKGIVEAVGFSPDGTLLGTAGEDSTAKLWDLRTGKELLTLTGHTFGLTDLAFNPSGTRLATASVDGTVRVYVLPVDELMAVARSRLTRGWTADECRRYLNAGRCPKKP